MQSRRRQGDRISIKHAFKWRSHISKWWGFPKKSHLLPMLLLVAEEAALGQVLQRGWRRRAVVLQAGWKVVPQGKVRWRVFARLCYKSAGANSRD